MNHNALTLRDMTAADVDEALRIEQQIYVFPWTRINFNDALAHGDICKILEADGELAGYLILSPAVDEMELHNIGVAAARQGKGLGRMLLDTALQLTKEKRMTRLLLEVRPSNRPALQLYQRAGFMQIGLRRDYYPSASGREDAIVMEYRL